MIKLSSNWLKEAEETGFGIDHLPIGIAELERGPALMIAVGQYAINLASLSAAGSLNGINIPLASLASRNLNKFLSAGVKAHTKLRTTMQKLMSSDAKSVEPHLHKRTNLKMLCPLAPGDFVDFYSSLAHAERCARLPNNKHALPDAWKSMPLAYHSRAGAIMPSGADISRPRGQVQTRSGVEYRSTRMLDFEMELGFVVRQATEHGQCLRTEEFAEYIFGVVLLNDWSARDLQGFEAIPLGPFHSKSFATQIADWVTPIEALEPFKCDKIYDPPVMSYLEEDKCNGYDLQLFASIASQKMKEMDQPSMQIADSNFREMYWSPSQQLAQLTANGAPINVGDLYGSGTVSGHLDSQIGCLLERIDNKSLPIDLTDQTTRTWLQDGDQIDLDGMARTNGHFVKLAGIEGSIVSTPDLCHGSKR